MEKKTIDFNNFDLNLLLVLDALLKDKSVTRAAERLHLTQPAVSNALSRLRSHFGDPILVRSAEGMQATPRALELEPHLKAALSLIESNVFHHEGFNPKTSNAKFTVAATDFVEFVVLPKLCERLYHEAPNLRIEFTPLVEYVPLHDLASGKLDIALGFFVESPGGLFVQTLFEEKFVTIARDDHPQFKGKKITLEQYTNAKHVLVSPLGGMDGVADEALRKLKLKRSVNVAVPHFLLAPLIAAGSDYIATVPERIARALENALKFHIQQPPVELRTFPATQVWHERTHHSEAHKWLRKFIADTAATL